MALSLAVEHSRPPEKCKNATKFNFLSYRQQCIHIASLLGMLLAGVNLLSPLQKALQMFLCPARPAAAGGWEPAKDSLSLLPHCPHLTDPG